MQCRPLTLPALVLAAAMIGAPGAHADNDNNTLIPNNKRLNDGVVANVYTIQHQAGCTNDVRMNPGLQRAAQQHARDVLNNRALDGDIGSDGSTPQDRANAAGFRGAAAETVAINQSIAISGNDLINRWYYNPAYFDIMSNCANSQLGVWSENSPDRTVVVALYGKPSDPVKSTETQPAEALPPGSDANDLPPDPSPDYDMSDELEHGLDWLPWILRGINPPPTYPPQ